MGSLGFQVGQNRQEQKRTADVAMQGCDLYIYEHFPSSIVQPGPLHIGAAPSRDGFRQRGR